MDSINMKKIGLFLATPSVIAFLLVDSCCKNKIGTNEPEIHLKNENSEPQPKLSGSY